MWTGNGEGGTGSEGKEGVGGGERVGKGNGNLALHGHF